ncbi:MAG: hypothetical protein SW833_17085 [Cyanobacteriota bacterium]|nr:hypothetical protein [Cyanobacteriota bacterium]
MTRSTQQIEGDLAELSEEVAALAEKLYGSYARYLKVLGQSIQKQLILASYQLCTQTYPEAFLALSLNQRQTLQQKIRQLGKQGQERLLLALEGGDRASEEVEENVEGDAIAFEEEMGDLELLDLDSEAFEQEAAPQEPESPPPVDAPDRLLHSIQSIEQTIQETLQTLSARANALLRDAHILPDRLPPKLMEMAVQSEEARTTAGNSPNLLNLLVEAEEADSDKENTVMQIIAVRLRLSELEFSDPNLGSERNQTRQWVAIARKLAKRFHKYRRELAIARAELTWRASWYEE